MTAFVGRDLGSPGALAGTASLLNSISENNRGDVERTPVELVGAPEQLASYLVGYSPAVTYGPNLTIQDDSWTSLIDHLSGRDDQETDNQARVLIADFAEMITEADAAKLIERANRRFQTPGSSHGEVRDNLLMTESLVAKAGAAQTLIDQISTNGQILHF